MNSLRYRYAEAALKKKDKIIEVLQSLGAIGYANAVSRSTVMSLALSLCEGNLCQRRLRLISRETRKLKQMRENSDKTILTCSKGAYLPSTQPDARREDFKVCRDYLQSLIGDLPQQVEDLTKVLEHLDAPELPLNLDQDAA